MVALHMLLTFVLLCDATNHSFQFYPFQNISLSFQDRVKDLVDRLSLDEIVEQLSHGGAEFNGPAPAIERLGIKPYQWGTECLSGDVVAGNATSFPMPLGMAATFNYDLIHDVAEAIGTEVRAKNNDAISRNYYGFHAGISCWSPVLNILRDPRWGRNQETYGEDPWLSGFLGHAYVTGLQGDHPRYVRANAGCKHFDVHGGPENIPVSRFSFDSQVTELDWRMTFLPQFKKCVEAGSLSLMCSYNSINGVPACANKKLLTTILRDEWEFGGYIVSDQGALENIVLAHKYSQDFVHAAATVIDAGTDLEDGNLPFKPFNVFANLEEAVNQNLTSLDTLKEAASRLFLVRMKLGEFDPPDLNPYKRLNLSVVQSPVHRMLTLKAALQSMVLLKNDEIGGLPLGTVEKACIVGPFIDNEIYFFGDYSPNIMPQYCSTPLSGISQFTNIGTKWLKAAEGCEDGPVCKSYQQRNVLNACKDADIVIATAGLSRFLEGEGNDRADINLPGHQLDLLKDATSISGNASVILVLFNAGPLDISWAKANPRVKSVIEAFYPAQSTGEALAKVLTGEYNPAGRLPNTWPASIEQVPAITNYTMVNRTYRYSNGIPLYPFGYGLSYTKFEFSELAVLPGVIKAGENVTVSVSVTNTGKMNGEEVIQVYIKWTNSTIPLPKWQLVGASRKLITRGNTVKVMFVILADYMEIWNEGKWTVPTGDIQVYVGGQQPGQKDKAPSNILTKTFKII